ncbi:MAG: sulfite dehydrogenase [Dehalococcoidia bacterium]|nr:sulfite dehydrogenase [Dehalococcoidia bacterium]
MSRETDLTQQDPAPGSIPRAPRFTRRQMLFGAASAAAAVALGGVARAQGPPEDPTKVPGALSSARGAPSPFEQLARASAGRSSSQTPLQGLDGMITPSGLHFERHHNGVPQIDPGRYRLIVHGMVERPMVFTLDDLKRYPAVSRIYFLECSGNSGSGLRAPTAAGTAQSVHGLTSTSEWLGVLMSTILREVKPAKKAAWALYESHDAAVMTRSIPMEKLWNDAMLAYGQNGEAIRPEQGYPVRSFLPGFEGNSQVKWLRRIEISDQPWQTREETSKYTDTVCPPDEECHARQFTFLMDAKSVITWPSGGQTVPGPGIWEIKGIAWSGKGFIENVEVSTDGGNTWNPAKLEQPVLHMAHTRFRFLWNWDGGPAMLMSRATDSTGYIQPTRQELIDIRGPTTGSSYHGNYIQPWRVAGNGNVTNGLA